MLLVAEESIATESEWDASRTLICSLSRVFFPLGHDLSAGNFVKNYLLKYWTIFPFFLFLRLASSSYAFYKSCWRHTGTEKCLSNSQQKLGRETAAKERINKWTWHKYFFCADDGNVFMSLFARRPIPIPVGSHLSELISVQWSELLKNIFIWDANRRARRMKILCTLRKHRNFWFSMLKEPVSARNFQWQIDSDNLISFFETGKSYSGQPFIVLCWCFLYKVHPWHEWAEAFFGLNTQCWWQFTPNGEQSITEAQN